MIRAFFVLISANLLFSACTQRMVCPAYQSAFIYDQDQLRQKFSYFEDDSTPKVFYTASKNRYLVAEKVSYRAKIRSMQTLAMKPIQTVVPDSLQPGYVEGEDGIVPGAEMDAAARSVIDSTYIVDVPQDTTAAVEEDSVYMISKDKEVRILKYDFPDSLILDPTTGKYVKETPKYYVKEVKFNVEQDNYMWYLRDYLVLPDVRLAHKNQGQNVEGKSAKGKKEKKGFFGFFKNIFKKKKKDAPADTTAQQAPAKPDDDFDYVDEEEQQKLQQQANPPAPEKKKGPFGFLKKKKKATAEPTAPADENAPPAEEKVRKKKSKKDKSTPEETPPTEEEKKKEETDGF